jgi:hypothetical protein
LRTPRPRWRAEVGSSKSSWLVDVLVIASAT